MTMYQIFHHLLGPGGRYLRGKWGPEEILHRLLKSEDIYVSRAVAVQVINGQKPFRRVYSKNYHEKGIELLQNDLKAFVKGYHSTALIRDICTQIHTVVATSDWTPEEIAAVERYYVMENPSRDQIAIYIAHVMYMIMCS